MKRDNKIKPKSQNNGGFQPAEEGRENLAPANETSTVQNAVITEGFNPPLLKDDDSASQNDENSTVQIAVITEGFNPPLLKDDDSLLKDGDSTLNNKGQ